MNKLYFAGKGKILLNAAPKAVIGWDMTTLQQCFLCPGVLVGLSRDGTILLTRQDAFISRSEQVLTHEDVEPIRAWNVATGDEILITSIKPESFEDYQRVFILKNRPPLTVELHDALGAIPSQVIENLGADVLAFDDTALAQDNESLIMTLFGDVAGHDWAEGKCFSRATGRLKYTFDVNRFAGSINLSVEHNLLVISVSNNTIEIRDASSGEKVQRITLPTGIGGNVVRVHPHNAAILAVCARRHLQSKTWPFHQERLCLLKKMKPDSANISTPPIMSGSFEEVGKIEDFVFHPDGRQIVSLNFQKQIHIWDISGRLVATLST